MKKIQPLGAAVVLALGLPVNSALAALSSINNNYRIFEDTIWLFTFTLMLITGFLMKNLSHGMGKIGYYFLMFTGITGWCWKFLGLAQRVFIVKEPAWLFSIARETFEGLTGVVLAIAFLLIAFSIRQIYISRD